MRYKFILSILFLASVERSLIGLMARDVYADDYRVALNK